MSECSLLVQGAWLLAQLAILRRAIAVDITGFVTSERHEYGIFNQQLDWFQAMSQCQEDGFQGLDVLPEMSSKVNLFMHVLRDNSYNTNATFWTGLFRPYPFVTKWYDSTESPCQSYSKSTVTGDVTCNQCVTVTFDNLYDQITLRAENCNSSFPYICYELIGPIKYDYYNDYIFTNISPYANVNVYTNVNVSSCEELCTTEEQCVGYTHSRTAETCSILYLNSGYGYMTYTIEPAEHTTHGYKTRLKPTYFPTATFTTPPEVNHTFPSCNVSDIPPGYCRCNISIQINDQVGSDVEELIQNLTVNKDETSKSRRRLTSADDSRTSAKAIGATGLAILIAFVVVIFVFDLNVLIQQIIMGINTLKRILNVGHLKDGKTD